MVDRFPTALQRTSDERWVSLDVVSCANGRAVAKIAESMDHAAVVRTDTDERYEATLKHLLHSPPPDGGDGVHMSWPVDLLHDLDGQVVGYTARRHSSTRTWPLASFVDPATRATFAPLATRRHLVRVARNTATATAALHFAGHAGIRGRQFRIDDRGHVVVVAVDELIPDAGVQRLELDQRRLGNLMIRLLSGYPWPADGQLASLLRQVGDVARPGASHSAEAWFFALREAEKQLAQAPKVATASSTALPATGTTPFENPAATLGLRPDSQTLDRHESAGVRPATTVTPLSSSPPRSRSAPATTSATLPVPARPPSRSVRDSLLVIDDSPARLVFALATAVAVGIVASVAPFGVFLIAAVGLVLNSAVNVGRRKSVRGPHQTVAIVLSRLVPFATGGLALAAFVLLDLLLILGLCMALAERLFGYGPGLTLTWVVQLPEVPGLVRIFAGAMGAFGGMTLGAELYDRIQSASRHRRRVTGPAIALAAAAAVLLADATVVWWPLPLAVAAS